jgi:sorbitol/mannitol transport system substrate-binding protein
MAFAQWATSTAYTELVAQEYGWTNVPPGTRASLYERTEYQDAAPFASLVKDAIDAADLENPTVDPVPYTGIQYVGIPEFQGIGTAVGNQVADALRGEVSADEALENSQWVTEKVIARTRLTNEEDS